MEIGYATPLPSLSKGEEMLREPARGDQGQVSPSIGYGGMQTLRNLHQ